MAYNANKPEAGDLLSQSQNDLQNNFDALKTLIDKNHETFAHASEGKHKHVTLTKQSPNPAIAPSTAADEFALYQKNDADGNPSIFIREHSDGDEHDIFNNSAATDGYSRLSSGMMMKWGSITCSVGQSTTPATFAGTGANKFAHVFSVSLTFVGNDGTANFAPFVSGIPGLTGINIYNPNNEGGTRKCYYVAIGD